RVPHDPPNPAPERIRLIAMPLHAFRQVCGLDTVRAVEDVHTGFIQPPEVAEEVPLLDVPGAAEVPGAELRLRPGIDDDGVVGDVVDEQVGSGEVGGAE